VVRTIVVVVTSAAVVLLDGVALVLVARAVVATVRGGVPGANCTVVDVVDAPSGCCDVVGAVERRWP
jgi:hypothetical protein